MNALRNYPPHDDLNSALHAMIELYGPSRVLAAAFRALFKPPPKSRGARSIDAVSDHLRRDIGLAPRPDQTPHWVKYR